MQDTRMHKGIKAPEIIAELLQLLGTVKLFFTHGGDWFRGGSMMPKHLYRFAHTVVWRLTPWLMHFPMGEATLTSAAYYDKLCGMPNIVATVDGTRMFVLGSRHRLCSIYGLTGSNAIV